MSWFTSPTSTPRPYERYGASDNDSPQISELCAMNEDEKKFTPLQSHEPHDIREPDPQLTQTSETNNGDFVSENHFGQNHANQFNPPPLTDGSSLKSLRSNHISLKSGQSNNSKKSGGSGGSRGSIGTMKSFQSSRNPILELLRDEVHVGSPPVDTEDEESDRSKWPVIGFIGFLVVLTLICAIVEVKPIPFVVMIFFGTGLPCALVIVTSFADVASANVRGPVPPHISRLHQVGIALLHRPRLWRRAASLAHPLPILPHHYSPSPECRPCLALRCACPPSHEYATRNSTTPANPHRRLLLLRAAPRRDDWSGGARDCESQLMAPIHTGFIHS
jgi:hypothetical protein